MVETNPLSNLSYTNKDFQTIYPELLDLVKKLSPKWDPTISNESDPGVLLLKLCAIIADKNDYNIDKNVLECFPLSVTQDGNARQLFEQLGYTMRWYRGGTTTVSMRWIGEVESGLSVNYTLKKFTMVADSDNSTVYTLIDDVVVPDDGGTVTVRAIQGRATEYIINNSNVVTPNMLDNENRLYFSDINVAENGIFISNADGTYGTEDEDDAYGGWRKVKNLAVEPLGKSLYKFGVTQDGSKCYIEFPEDVESLMGQGVYITYIKTEGSQGNIASRVLEKFFTDTFAYVEVDGEEQSVQITSDDVQITNVSGVSNGTDPETIEDAYRNYKKTIGTFDTLVTLRDYTNAINESGLVSNSFVTDRTNDIQSSYNVISYDENLTKKILQVEKDGDGEPLLDAYDLKIYALNYVSSPSDDASSYNSSFEVCVNDTDSVSPSLENVLAYIQDTKSIPHDFNYILRNKICLLKNKYIISCKIIPQYRITDVQSRSISESVRTALFNAFNSQKIDFGEEVSYEAVYNTIMDSDERIKAVVLENLVFNTYAVYYDGTSFKEVLINDIKEQTCGYYFNGNFYSDAEHTQLISPVTGNYYTDISFDTAYSSKVYLYNGYEYKEDVVSEIQNTIYAKSVLNGNTQILSPDQQYTETLGQNHIATINNIESLTTNADMEFEGTGEATYDIKNNEHLFLYAPNLSDVTNYSTYVKYQFVINNDIEADSDYMLSDGESITFYWTTEEDESTYIYYKYGKGQIIHPNFKLLASNSSTSGYVGNNGDLRDVVTGTGTVPSISIEVGGVYYEQNDYIKTNFNRTPTSKCVLTSTRSVVIRRKNQIELDPKVNICYWILNSKQPDGTYRLFAENQTSYILQTDEFFLYTNSARSEIAILGSGTQISRENDDSEWKVVATDYTKVAEEGASAVADNWFTIPSTAEVTITETQFKSINEGNTFKLEAYVWNKDNSYSASGIELTTVGDTPMSKHIKATLGGHCYNSADGKSWTAVNTTASINVTINNNGVSVTSPEWSTGDPYKLSDFTMSYATSGATDYTVIPDLVLDDGWNGFSILSFNASPTDAQFIEPTQSITWKDVDDSTGTITDAYVLSDYAYELNGGKDVDVTRIDTIGRLSYMNLYVYTNSESSDDDIQYVDNGVVITLDAENDASEYEWVENDDKYSDISNLFEWQQDATTSTVGEELSGVGVSPITEGITPSATAFHYYNNDFDGNGNAASWTAVHSAIEYTTTGYTPTSQGDSASYGLMAFNSADQKAWIACGKIIKTLDFNLPIGTYVLPLQLDNSFEGVTVEISGYLEETVVSNTLLSTIYNTAETSFKNASVYYLDMNLEELYNTHSFDSIKLTVTCLSSEGTKKIQFLPLYKYILPNIDVSSDNSGIQMSKGVFEAILHTVFTLDSDSLYDYTYIVDSDDEVPFPLKAESFFDVNHIYNKFVICQIDTNNMSLYVTNKIK